MTILLLTSLITSYVFWRHSLSPGILLGQVKPLSIFFLEAVVRVVILTDSWMRYWTLKDNRNNNNRNLKVAWYSFSRSIPPKFERKLRRHKQRFGKMDTTVILNKDETLLWSGLQWHRSCHGITYFTCNSISRHWELFFQNRLLDLFPTIAASMFVKFKRNL